MSRDEVAPCQTRTVSSLSNLFVSRISSQVVHSVDSLFIKCAKLTLSCLSSFVHVSLMFLARGEVCRKRLGLSRASGQIRCDCERAVSSCSIRGRSITEECSAVHLKTVHQMCCQEIHLSGLKPLRGLKGKK